MSKKKKEQRLAEQNVSGAYLLRMFEEHQLESMGDISQRYRKLERSLGYRVMQFQEYLKSTGGGGGADGLYELESIVRWKKQCSRWTLDPGPAEYMIRDNCSIAAIIRHIGYPRDRVVFHIRGCLTVWSVNANRCGRAELEPYLSLNTVTE
jgi:hypothetical protein